MHNPNVTRASLKRNVAALGLIGIKRADRAATSSSKVGDLSEALKHRVYAVTCSSPQDADEHTSEATSASPVPKKAELPEPYLVQGVEPTPSYIVSAAAALPMPHVPAVRAQSPPLPYDDIRTADDLVYYWDELRGCQTLPLLANLDRMRIAVSWPDTLLVSFGADRSGMPEITRLSRFTGMLDATTIVTDWILSCSREVAKIGRAMETQRTFAGGGDAHQYHMMLLPFASARGTSDHVLCHFSRSG
jgi:hypothetical protein